MGSFSTIAYLCEKNKVKELEEEVTGLALMMGKEPKEVAEEFIEAYKIAESQKNTPEYKQVAGIQKKAVEFYTNEYLLDRESKK